MVLGLIALFVLLGLILSIPAIAVRESILNRKVVKRNFIWTDLK